MGISINDFNGLRLAEIKSVSAHGVPGCGVYVLYLRLTVGAANLKSEALVSQLACRLEVAEPNFSISNGVIENNPIIRWAECTGDSQLGFLFYLSASQINSIEEVRNDGDLKLGIWLSGVVDYDSRKNGFSDKGDYVIPKQQWLEALSSMNYKDTLLFELPMPKAIDSSGDRLKVLLEKAQNHILNGHYQETISMCRQTIELVENRRGDKSKAKDAVAKYKVNPKEMNVTERMLFLREGLKNITHLGAHPGDEFSRQQAQSVLGMTIALLSSSDIGLQNILTKSYK